jgi:hypothetical protein
MWTWTAECWLLMMICHRIQATATDYGALATCSTFYFYCFSHAELQMQCTGALNLNELDLKQRKCKFKQAEAGEREVPIPKDPCLRFPHRNNTGSTVIRSDPGVSDGQGARPCHRHFLLLHRPPRPPILPPPSVVHWTCAIRREEGEGDACMCVPKRPTVLVLGAPGRPAMEGKRARYL